MSKLLASPLPLVLILLLATVLRIWGITWGLPSATHYFGYHPDESVVLGASMGMNSLLGKLLPHFYRYGSLQLYLVNFANTLGFLTGAVNIVTHGPQDYADWARMCLVGRYITAAMGVGTVAATYALGRTLWGRRVGLFGALLLAILPLHAQHSHWLTVDVPATFWGTLSLCSAARLAPDFAKNTRTALTAGLFAGLACATKYNMALAILPLIAAAVLQGRRDMRRGLKALGAGLGAFAAAFLIGCPGSVLETPVFLRDIQAEALHVSRQPGPTFENTGSGFVYHITQNLDAGMGLPLLLLSLAGVAYALYRRGRGDGLLAAFALPYYILIGLAAVRYTRYAIPLLPALALWAGRLLADLTRAPRLAWRAAAIGAAAAIVLFTLADCLWLVRPMTRKDPRDQALDWLSAQGCRNAAVGFAAMPWFQTPPLSPYFAAPRRGSWRRMTPPEEAARSLYHDKDWDMEILTRERPQIVLLSEYDTRDALRLHDPDAAAFLARLHQDYTQAAVFDQRTDLLGLSGEQLPHDMLYTSPTTWIYRRKQ